MSTGFTIVGLTVHYYGRHYHVWGCSGSRIGGARS